MASEIKTMQDSLNVKKNNLNNKRLSRLQGVILKILAVTHPLLVFLRRDYASLLLRPTLIKV